ncbi:MAG: spore coat protein GerQ [Bacilli bacterium]|nr:spore coat protein GerQ [Bacilli bacterium]MBR3209785.1 spore coat protein GerQ [Bacilli bacterium]
MLNNGFANQGSFPGNPLYSTTVPNQQNQVNFSTPVFEQSYIENILRLNKGKKVQVYASYPDSTEWRNMIFNGIIEQSGRDHLILSDPKTGNWYLILIIYVNYIKFDEKIISNPDFYLNN